MNDVDLIETKRLAQEMVNNPTKKNFKYRKNPADIKFLYGNTQEVRAQCPNCRKVFLKNNGRQIVYFCSKECRRSYRGGKTKFEVVK